METVGYCDLNIPNGPECEATARAAVKLGYLTLAINTPFVIADPVVNNYANKGAKKRKWEATSAAPTSSASLQSPRTDVSIKLPDPPSLPWKDQLAAEHPSLRIFQRITLIFNNIHQLQDALTQPNAKLFHIIAILPTSHQSLLASLTSALVFDIITFDFEGPHWIQKLRFNRQKGDLAAGKEIYFELSYAAAKHGDVALENLIYTAHTLVEDICVRKVKNLILTSGAMAPHEVKSPIDVISIAFLLDLDERSAGISYREVPNRIIQKTDGRKFGKTCSAFIPTATPFSFSDTSQLESTGVQEPEQT